MAVMALPLHLQPKKFQHQRYDSHGVISPSGTSISVKQKLRRSPTGAVGEIFSLTNLVVAVVCSFDRRTLFAPTDYSGKFVLPQNRYALCLSTTLVSYANFSFLIPNSSFISSLFSIKYE